MEGWDEAQKKFNSALFHGAEALKVLHASAIGAKVLPPIVSVLEADIKGFQAKMSEARSELKRPRPSRKKGKRKDKKHKLSR